MASLLDRLSGIKISEKISDEIGNEIPDEIPEGWAEEFTPDPPPGTAKPVKPLTPKTAGPVGPALKKRISAEIEMYIELAAMPIVMRDPQCGGALHAQAAPIAAAITQILSRYPEMAHKFLATSAMGDWLKLAMALQPVGQAVWEHHITKPLEEVTSDTLDLDAFPVYRPGQ